MYCFEQIGRIWKSTRAIFSEGRILWCSRATGLLGGTAGTMWVLRGMRGDVGLIQAGTVLFLLLLAGFLIGVGRRRKLGKLFSATHWGWGIILALLALMIHQGLAYQGRAAWENELDNAHFRRGIIRVRLDDFKISQAESLQFASVPRLVSGQLLEVGFANGEPPVQASGQVALFLSQTLTEAELQTWHNGDEVILEGAFRAPEPQIHFLRWMAGDQCFREVGKRDFGEWGGAAHSFEAYLAARGNRWQFQARKQLPLQNQIQQHGAFWSDRRDGCCDLLNQGIASTDSRTLLAALVLGNSRGMNNVQRKVYAASGVVHLFSISGLHIGVVASLLLLLLRGGGVSVRWRWIFLVLLLGYVWLTGANAPALRAFLVLFSFTVLGSRLLRVRSVDLLALTATGLLLWNPEFLADAGFQYSFLITFFLLWSADRLREFHLASGAETRLMLQPGFGRMRRLLIASRQLLGETFLVATIAGMAGGALSWFYQGYFFPGTVILNVLLLPLVWGIFLVSLGKLLLCGVGVGWICNGALEWMTEVLDALIRCGSEFAAHFRFGMIPGSIAVLLLILLVFAVRGKWWWLRWGAWSIGGGIILLFAWKLAATPPEAMLISGGSAETPAQIIWQKGATQVVVCDPASGNVQLIAQLLQNHSVREIDVVFLSGNHVDAYRALQRLEAAFVIRRVVALDPVVRGSAVRAMQAALPASQLRHGHADPAAPEGKIYQEGSWSVWGDAAGSRMRRFDGLQLELRAAGNGLWRWQVAFPGQEEAGYEVRNSREIVISGIKCAATD